MGHEPSTSGSAVSVAAGDPERIRKEIEATRQELGETIEALAERTDVRAHAKRVMEESHAYISKKTDDLLAKVRETSPESLVSAAHHAAGKARDNPIELAAISAGAIGFVAGRRSRCSTRTSTPS
jgi:Protein of unknown function (DUF3618)